MNLIPQIIPDCMPVRKVSGPDQRVGSKGLEGRIFRD